MKRKIPIKPGILIMLKIGDKLIPKRITSYALPARTQGGSRVIMLLDLRPGGSVAAWTEECVHENGTLMDELGQILYGKD